MATPSRPAPGAPAAVACVVAIVSLLAGACARSPAPAPPQAAAPAAPAPTGPRAAQARPLVLTTALPLTLFTRAVAEGCATVEPLSSDGGDPHHSHARPGDLARLGKANVLVANGLGLEASLEAGIAAAAPPDLVRIEASRGVTPLKGPDGAPNPHVWLDPQRAIQQVQAIRDGLGAADPGCQARYTVNAAAFITQLKQLDGDLASQLAPLAGRRFVVSHDLAPYLAARYQLRSEPLVPTPDSLPSPADLQRVGAVARAEGLQALLAEPGGHHGGDLQTVASDLGLRLLAFDPLETLPAGATAGPDHYLDTMRRNGKALVSALGG